MRIALLILGIIGSLLAIAFGACAGACAGALGGGGEGLSAIMQEAAEQAAKESGEEMSEEDKAQLAEVQEGLSEMGGSVSALGNIALFAGIQGVLGLIGCIMAFIALGKGNKATIGGVLLLVAVVISLWAGEFPSIGISNILHLLAGIFAFVAAPTVAAAAEA